MKITLARMFLITTLVCVTLGLLSPIGFNYSCLDDFATAEYNVLMGHKVDPPKITDFGSFLATMIGAGIAILAQMVLVVFTYTTVVYLWKITEYKE